MVVHIGVIVVSKVGYINVFWCQLYDYKFHIGCKCIRIYIFVQFNCGGRFDKMYRFHHPNVISLHLTSSHPLTEQPVFFLSTSQSKQVAI